MRLDEITEQFDLLTDFEETDDGIRADIATDTGRIQSEVTFHDDGDVTETVVIFDGDENEMTTETVEYGWEEVQRGFLKDVLRDYTDLAGGSRRVRLTGSQASAIVSVCRNVADIYADDLNPAAVDDLQCAADRIEDAFHAEPDPRVDAGAVVEDPDEEGDT